MLRPVRLSSSAKPVPQIMPSSSVRPDAQANASSQMNGDYVGCKRPYFLVSDGQLADGTWWARVEANGCTGYR